MRVEQNPWNVHSSTYKVNKPWIPSGMRVFSLDNHQIITMIQLA